MLGLQHQSLFKRMNRELKLYITAHVGVNYTCTVVQVTTITGRPPLRWNSWDIKVQSHRACINYILYIWKYNFFLLNFNEHVTQTFGISVLAIKCSAAVKWHKPCLCSAFAPLTFEARQKWDRKWRCNALISEAHTPLSCGRNEWDMRLLCTDSYDKKPQHWIWQSDKWELESL